jgi:hypothetical protein
MSADEKEKCDALNRIDVLCNDTEDKIKDLEAKEQDDDESVSKAAKLALIDLRKQYTAQKADRVLAFTECDYGWIPSSELEDYEDHAPLKVWSDYHRRINGKDKAKKKMMTQYHILADLANQAQKGKAGGWDLNFHIHSGALLLSDRCAQSGVKWRPRKRNADEMSRAETLRENYVSGKSNVSPQKVCGSLWC